MKTEDLQPYIPKNVEVTTNNNIAYFKVQDADIITVAADLNAKNLQLNLITATDEREAGQGFKVWYVFGVPQKNIFIVPYIQLNDTTEFPSLTPIIHKA